MPSLIQGPSIFYQVMSRLRDDLTAAFTASDLASWNRVGIVPGAIAWDECNQCGLLALSCVRIFLSNDFPSELVSRADDGAPYLCADLAIQGIRCAPSLNDAGDAPAVSALESSALQVNSDALLITCTTLDTLEALTFSFDIVTYGLRQQLFLGPEGLCVGSELGVVVAVTR